MLVYRTLLETSTTLLIVILQDVSLKSVVVTVGVVMGLLISS